MTRGDFHELLRRVEARYRDRPEALGRSMTAWVRVGQAGVAAWLLLLFLLAGGVFAAGVVIEPPGGLILLALGVALAVYAIAQAGLFLLTDAPTPDGQPLRPGEAPGLVALLDDLRRDLKCRPFDEVRLSMDFNAGVSEVPRLGVFGWSRTILEVGLPLMLTLPPEEFRAVLAHELVHLSGRHGRAGARIQRLHRLWSAVFARLHAPGGGRARGAAQWVVSTFVNWYWPRLRARSLALSRHHEFQADRFAAGVAGAGALAAALWRLECRGPWLAERFWPDLHRGALVAPEPPADVLEQLRRALLAPAAPTDAKRWADRALARRTALDETHPSFFDRARALGVEAEAVARLEFAGDAQANASAALLGADLDRLMGEHSERWRLAERASWRERHRRAAAEARRGGPAALPAAPGATPPPAVAQVEDVAALWVAVRSAADLRGLEAAEPLLRGVLDRSPAHPGASVLLGQHLLGLGDAEGERLLWAVAEAADEQWTPPACQALESHYRAAGRPDRQREARDRLDRHEVAVVKARAERAAVAAGDAFLPHALAPEALGALVVLLAGHAECRGGWLARKAVRHFPDRPLFVLAVNAPAGRWGFADPDRDAALVRALVPKVHLPGQVLVIGRFGGFGKLARKVASLPGARVYPAD